MRLRALLCGGLVLWLGLAARASGPDNDVEWNGLSHLHWADRTPLCPIAGESFTVAMQCYRYDLTGVRLRLTVGGVPQWLDGVWIANRGPYDVWRVTVPATSPTAQLSYYFEVTDGTDTDYLGPAGPSDGPPAAGWTLDFATLSHAPLGATLTSDGGAVFKVWAPGATTASVAGQFNGWSTTSLPMSKSGGFFTRKVAPPVSANQKYKFVFNGNNWRTDARARAMDQGDNGNSILVNPGAYAWGDGAFQMPAFEELVIYELHVGTFSGRNDGLNRAGRFRDIVDRHLDHLLYLGVNAVQLMPVTEFDYHESWGYNPILQFGPEGAYGSPADLKYTIDRLRQHGIAVLLDVVYNHFSPTGNFLWNYDGTQIYFDNPAVGTPWGSQADFDRWEVADYFVDATLLWLEEYRADGFRMDATRYMRDNFIFPGGQPSGWALMQRINNEIDRRKGQAISIAEELPNEPMITTPAAWGGAGFDSQWHDQWNDDVRQEVFDAAYGDPEMWKIAQALNAPGYPNKTHLVRYVEGHDEAAYGRLAVAIDSSNPYSKWAQGRSKLAQGLTILAPGIPMFLQGGEWLEDTPFGSAAGNRIDWSKAVARAPIVQFFRDVIHVRRTNCGFRSNAGCEVHHVDDFNNIIAFHRWCDSGNDLVVVASLRNSDIGNYRVGFPQGGVWYEILNSQALDYLGNGSGNGGQVTAVAVPYDGMPYSAVLTVPEMGLLVFRHNEPPPRPGDLNCDGAVDFDDIDAFVLALSGPGGYGAAYPQCRWLNADCNGDGAVNFDDIDAFVARIGS